MDSSVKSRPNYYETLGLKPGASDDEITQAFTKRMSLSGLRPVGGAAQVCVAYETLRDPARRREHDRALGLAPKAEPRQWAIPSLKPRWEPFIAAPVAEAAKPSRSEPATAPEPHAPKREPEPEASHQEAATAAGGLEPRTASFIAEALRELAKPIGEESRPESPLELTEPCPAPSEPDVVAASEQPNPVAIEPDIREVLANPSMPYGRSYYRERRRFDWKRPALAVGGLMVAAGAVGIAAGLSSSRNGEGTAQTAPAVTVALPSATERADLSAPVPAATETALGTQPQLPVEAEAPRSATVDAPPRQARGSTEKAISDAKVETAAADSRPVDTAADPLAPIPSAADTAKASLPLPNNVVARTIERIGYSCGDVTSTTPVDGGVFKVTCSSGQSYRAAPVNGRYHFRRW